jgi:nucleotide-binding universal stress UspA family protein
LRAGPTPMIIPGGTMQEGPRSRGWEVFSNIVVGTDGSETAQRAISLAAEIAKADNAVLHLVNAYKEPSGWALSKSTLAEAASGAGVDKIETHSKGGAPADAIISVAEEVGADLIVVGSKGMRGARRMIGSVPSSVAHGAPCHVIIAKTT